MPTLFSSLLFLPNLSQPSSANSRRRKNGLGHRCNYTLMVFASRRYDYGGGNGTVDENMVVLRKRILEMKKMEKNHELPEDWMEWEKRYYEYYNSDVCEAVGLLQTQLMKSRPSMVLGMVALVTLSVPTSMFIVAFHLLEIAKWILSGIHLS
ncbi:hypothetical protein NE237_019744 [Protea cynaroides]|uniref:Mediator of RNA polymerase II transcription subunit n=1 Tax=Protea cynaroides TaxID=273540 RepID=A0A9Q0H5Y5_9MAGN|nr:hypothetical protein NE237_019744 [Protea cynaroides]